MPEQQLAPGTAEPALRPAAVSPEPEVAVPDAPGDLLARRAIVAAAASGAGAGAGSPSSHPTPRGLPPGAIGPAALLGIQRSAGNRAVAGLVAGTRRPAPTQRPTVQRQGQPASEQDLQDVVDLMPIMPAIDSLVSAVENECASWTTWRSSMTGPVPGANAYRAMDQFKDAVRGQGFVYHDERIQKVLRRRVTGDKRQALTEMTSFALGTGGRGDYTGLARVFGAQAGRLLHKYTLKIAYSAGIKGKAGIGVGYTYRSAAVQYDNDFGMTYNKPLNMRSLVASIGPGINAKVKGKPLESLGGVGLASDAKTDSMIFWLPDDWETEFQVVKVAGGGQAGVKYEVKVLELVRVMSGKHPPLLFDLLGGQHITDEWSAEVGVGAGAGVDIEFGVFVGGKDVGETTVSAPSLEEARKKAQEAKLIPPDEVIPQWRVIDGGTISFPTGSADIPGDQYKTVVDIARRVATWVGQNPGSDVLFEIVGQASPRWRHPRAGQIPDDLNRKLSVERAKNARGALEGAWWGAGGESGEFRENGQEGPPLELTDDRARVEGTGSLKARSEGKDPDNDDAGYRVAVITVSGKPAAPEPAGG
jgi:hypothetical protein